MTEDSISNASFAGGRWPCNPRTSGAAADPHKAGHLRIVGPFHNPGIVSSSHWVYRYVLEIPGCHKVIHCLRPLVKIKSVLRDGGAHSNNSFRRTASRILGTLSTYAGSNNSATRRISETRAKVTRATLLRIAYAPSLQAYCLLSERSAAADLHSAVRLLRFRLGLQLDLPFRQLHGELHFLTAVLLPDLLGLLLHERRE